MDLFIRGGFRALMDERERQEKLELEASDKLPRELIKLVLEYTRVSDVCLNRNNFDDRQFKVLGAVIANVRTTVMWGFVHQLLSDAISKKMTIPQCIINLTVYFLPIGQFSSIR